MELIGVEFENFACFNKCFVPLGLGVQALVGKNNSGKTALLRGLTSLSALPLVPRQGFSVDLKPYERPASQVPGFAMRVLFQVGMSDHLSYSDFTFMEVAADRWRETAVAERPVLSFHFRVLPRESFVGLEVAQLHLAGREIHLIERGDNCAILRRYNSQLEEMHTERVNINQQGTSSGTWSVFQPSGIFECLAHLGSIRQINVHRAVEVRAGLRTEENLAPDAINLTPYLDGLQGNQKRRFQEIERFLLKVFPEFESLNLEKRQNQIVITLTLASGAYSIPLTHCGTGVEQILALATLVLSSPPSSIILMDEPHSYLHPTAERALITLLNEHSEHRYVISTHSAVLINELSPDKVVCVDGLSVPKTGPQPSVAHVLRQLGYMNSDLLFNERLIFVEGESDQKILPILLEGGGVSRAKIQRTGFPPMNGGGRLRAKKLQNSMRYYERLLYELGRAHLRRIYLFDGDCEKQDQSGFSKICSPVSGQKLDVRYLGMRELENYLLIPEAIAATIQELKHLESSKVAEVCPADIAAALRELFESENSDLFPSGKSKEPVREIRGSAALEMVFERFGISFDKKTTGALLARYVSLENQPHLQEIADLLCDAFA